jgi:hypothetical protein
MAGNMRMVEGDYGFNHEFVFPSGTDLSWANTSINLIITDGTTEQLNITSNLTKADNIVTWAVQNGQTDFNGDYDGVLVLTGATRNEEIHFKVDMIAKKS